MIETMSPRGNPIDALSPTARDMLVDTVRVAGVVVDARLASDPRTTTDWAHIERVLESALRAARRMRMDAAMDEPIPYTLAAAAVYDTASRADAASAADQEDT